MAEFYALGVAAVFAADAELDLGPALPPFLDGDLHELADAGLVEGRERVLLEDLVLDVRHEEVPHVVAADPKRQHVYLGVNDSLLKDFRAAIEVTRRYGESPALPPAAENASIDQLRQALHATPDNYGAGFQLYHAQMEHGLVDEALMTVRHFTDLPGCSRYFHFLEAEAWAAKQNWERAWRAREKFEAAK